MSTSDDKKHRKRRGDPALTDEERRARFVAAAAARARHAPQTHDTAATPDPWPKARLERLARRVVRIKPSA